MRGNSITFLGSAGDTTSVGKQLRASGGIVINYNNSQMHIDPGPGALCQYKNCRISPRNTISLIVTNNDLAYCGDTNAVVSAMTHDGLDRRGVLVGSRSVINGTADDSPILWNRFSSFLEKNIPLDQGQRIGINEYDIHAIPSFSSDPTGFGLIINTPEFKIVYSSNTKFSDKLAEAYGGCDVLILKAEIPEEEEGNDSMTLDQASSIINECIPRVAILTGFGAKMIYNDPLYLAKQIHKKTGVYVIAAQDGMSIDPVDYSKPRK